MLTDLPLLQSARRLRLPRFTLGHVTLIALSLIAVWLLSRVLLLIFFAILLAASLRGAADWVRAHTRLPMAAALPIVMLTAFGLLAGLFWLTGPTLYAQIQDLSSRLLSEVGQLRRHFGGTLLPQPASLPGIAEQVISPVASILTFSIDSVTEILVAIITAVYFAGAPSVYVGGLVKLLPVDRRMRARSVIEAVGQVLRKWVLGQLIDMLLVGVLSAAGLWLVGTPAPLALGLLSGLLTFVPYLGTIVAGILAVVISLSAGYTTALYALGVFVLVHLIEGYVVSPIVQRRLLDLPPALSVLSMTVLGSLFGLPGIVLGTPLAATLLTLVQSLYVGDVLGDHSVDVTSEQP